MRKASSCLHGEHILCQRLRPAVCECPCHRRGFCKVCAKPAGAGWNRYCSDEHFHSEGR